MHHNYMGKFWTLVSSFNCYSEGAGDYSSVDMLIEKSSILRMVE